ncbi:hypothetical protein [Streptomyces erythrochromogenes]|uniref:hypothetical protein n=1 Tax=Streptomyces erythrochromogenes TaxID=285574 RepID=UPI0037F9DFF7
MRLKYRWGAAWVRSTATARIHVREGQVPYVRTVRGRFAARALGLAWTDIPALRRLLGCDAPQLPLP